jgi:hypothetical protein
MRVVFIYVNLQEQLTMKRFLLVMITMTLLFAMPAWAKTRSGLVTMEFDLGGQPAGEVVRLWIPYPVSNQHQLISKLRLNGDYAVTGFTPCPPMVRRCCMPNGRRAARVAS